MRSSLRAFGQRRFKKVLLALCAGSMLTILPWQRSGSAAPAEADPVICRILLTDKREASRQYQIKLSEGEDLVIGRGTQCRLVIPGEKTISRRHCRV